MKYYSEVTRKTYDSEKDCLVAENEYKARVEKERKAQEEARAKELERKEQQAAERKQAAAEVDAAYKALQEARSTYSKALEKFCDKYGSYHTSLKVKDIPTLFDFFDLL